MYPTNFYKESLSNRLSYEIKTGDTIGSIAQQFYTTVDTILKANPDVEPNNLQVGQIICITEQLPQVPICPSLNINVINPNDTLYKIPIQLGITLEKLIEVNPNLDLYNLKVGDVICLPLTPTPYIIVIDNYQKQLFLYYLGRLNHIYEIAVGKPTTPTPLGQFYIMNKQVNPGGPFGTRWMGLSKPSYGIHGTNRPDSIGTAASNGCIRLYNPDVEELFSKVSVFTPVIIK